MHDFINLLQVLFPFVLGLLTWKLNDKKSDREYLQDENDRLNEENKRLSKKLEEISGKDKENDS